MRKVHLSMKAQQKYDIIKKSADGHITKSYASVKIGCTPRHIKRLLKNIKLVERSLSSRQYRP